MNKTNKYPLKRFLIIDRIGGISVSLDTLQDADALFLWLTRQEKNDAVQVELSNANDAKEDV
jgi:hypothetical protein